MLSCLQLDMKLIKIKQRIELCENGLQDRNEVVRAACTRMIREKWLGKNCEGDPVKFLTNLDVHTWPEQAERALKVSCLRSVSLSFTTPSAPSIFSLSETCAKLPLLSKSVLFALQLPRSSRVFLSSLRGRGCVHLMSKRNFFFSTPLHVLRYR